MIFLYVFLLIAVFSVLMAVLMKWTVRIAGKTIAGRVDYLHRKAQFLIETGAFHPEWIRKGIGTRPYPQYRRFLRKEFRSLTRYFKRTPVFEDAQAGGILMEKLGSAAKSTTGNRLPPPPMRTPPTVSTTDSKVSPNRAILTILSAILSKIYQ